MIEADSKAIWNLPFFVPIPHDFFPDSCSFHKKCVILHPETKLQVSK